MSSMTFGQKSFQTRPPDKGSFPLDHEGECKAFMKTYMSCLHNNNMNNTKCRQQSKDYLECRMESAIKMSRNTGKYRSWPMLDCLTVKQNLMAREDWKKLGYADLQETAKNLDKASL